jgi:hypothetical protein
MEDSNVAMYRISAVCNACGDLHTIGTTINLSAGPVNKQSIADAYPNKDPPAEIAALKGGRVHCLKIGRHLEVKAEPLTSSRFYFSLDG